MAELTVGLNSPDLRAVALASFRLLGKCLAQPGFFSRSMRLPRFASSIMVIIMMVVINTAGSDPPWLPSMRVGKPVHASSFRIDAGTVVTNLYVIFAWGLNGHA